MKVGIERLEEFQSLFDNKKVGLITNPTGVDRQFQTTIDRLNDTVQLVALFSPEHGVRGDLQAGVRLDDYTDPDTGCIVYSLYGKNKQPTDEMMASIDILAFDIQDVGARFYTYLYTMAYALKACAKANKELVVFDRPNPLGGTIVEGNILKSEFSSFVGNYGLPQRYGLTIGELALYFNQEFDIGANVTVVPMEGYTRDMTFTETSFPWVFPSPNIPTMETPLYYVSTCVFEGTNISEGRGTTKPFQLIGSPFFQPDNVIDQMKTYDLPGVAFRSLYFTPTFSKHKGELCQGIEVYITDETAFQPVFTGMVLLKVIQELHPEFAFNKPYKEGLHPMMDLLNGDNFLRTGRLSIPEIQAKIKEDSERFNKIKRRYHLYETAS